MKRQADPKQEKIRAERNRAALWLDVLSKGIGLALQEDCRYRHEETQPIIDLVNGPLAEAVADAQRAEKAYEPYWARRRRRVSIGRKPKKKAAA